ncbi:MAG: hypothetical protein OEQ81_00930 [Flavobacteriaceae bacterium]|nr:hypothetical protein [Flavobacteriaceae bacterium]
MSKITLIGIALISVFALSEPSLKTSEAAFNTDYPLKAASELVNTPEYQEYGGICTVTTHGYIWVDGATIYFRLTVEGPCDSRIADMVRDAIRELRGIK